MKTNVSWKMVEEAAKTAGLAVAHQPDGSTVVSNGRRGAAIRHHSDGRIHRVDVDLANDMSPREVAWLFGLVVA